MFFEKCLFRFSSRLKIGLLFFFFAIELSCMGSLYILDTNPLLYMICKYFLPLCKLPFRFVDGFLCWVEAF